MRFVPAVLLILCGLTSGAVKAAAQQRIIYDDDCSQDVDCVATLPMLFQLEAQGKIQIMAMMADSANPESAAVMRLFARAAGRDEVPIGANQGGEPSMASCAQQKCNESKWTSKLVERFDRGDSRSHYSSCVTTYRKVLAAQPAHSVSIVETGFATCLVGLLGSPPDPISPLSGEALVRRTVKQLSIMGGKYPFGTEWNFECDAPDYHALFSQWTRQNGFPPVYLNGFANGLDVLAGPPADASPEQNPTAYGLRLAKVKQRPMWDMLSVLFIADGGRYFKLSHGGTVSVDPLTGADRWSETTDSGQYILTNAVSAESLSALLDGYKHRSGLLAETKYTH